MSNRQTGTVKWFNDEKKASASSLHNPVTTCSFTSKLSNPTASKSLKEGQQVSFIATRGQKGMQAEEVQVI